MNQIIWLLIMVGAVGYIAGFVTMAALAVGKRADYLLKIQELNNQLKEETKAKESLTNSLIYLRNMYQRLADDYEKDASERRVAGG